MLWRTVVGSWLCAFTWIMIQLLSVRSVKKGFLSTHAFFFFFFCKSYPFFTWVRFFIYFHIFIIWNDFKFKWFLHPIILVSKNKNYSKLVGSQIYQNFKFGNLQKNPNFLQNQKFIFQFQDSLFNEFNWNFVERMSRL